MQKLRRAETHLETLRAVDSKFRLLEISMPFVRDEARGVGYNVLKLPDPPGDVALVIGDCLHNLRSVLDYTVWQAVLFGGKLDPDRRTMFPICQSEEEFAKQLKRSRLRGLPDAAVAVVKSLQPIGQPRNPLVLLDEFCNSDKHRDFPPWWSNFQGVGRSQVVGSELGSTADRRLPS